MTTPIHEKLIAWKQALTDGDVFLALELHDEVTAHLIKNQDSASVFQTARMNPDAFVQWAEQKKPIREQLAKSPQDMHDDFQEALDEIEDLAANLSHAKTARDVIEMVGEIQEHLQKCVINASHIDSDEFQHGVKQAHDEPPEVANNAPGELMTAEQLEAMTMPKIRELAQKQLDVTLATKGGKPVLIANFLKAQTPDDDDDDDSEGAPSDPSSEEVSNVVPLQTGKETDNSEDEAKNA